jgi:DNA-binding response OmpR family regulator
MAGGTILITEDESEIRELLCVLFQSEGYTVHSASDGREALELVRAHASEIQLLITDLGLPKLGGIELIKLAREIVPSLQVIAASGFGHVNVRSELRKVGVVEFFPKPFSPIDLLERAKIMLDKEQQYLND